MIRNRLVSLLPVLLLCVFVLSMPVLSADDSKPVRETIRIGIFSLAPFMKSTENGDASGASVDFWREYLAPAMNVDIVVSGPSPIPRLEMMLEKGEIDVIPYITKILDRETRFLYPSRSLTAVSSCIVVRRDSPLETINAQEDLFGMTIGYITSGYVPPFILHEQIELELVTTTEFREINHRKLMNGRVDALLDINYLSLVYEMNSKGYSKDIRIIPLDEDRVAIYSLFGQTYRGRKLRALYDEIMETVPPDAFDTITRRYLVVE